jgi:SagB-type dehydrogenase family enzyme
MIYRRLLGSAVLSCLLSVAVCAEETKTPKIIPLPAPQLTGKMSVEAAIVAKRTARDFKQSALTKEQVGQVLWAANGNIPADTVTGATRKVIPSAGALHPIEVFLVCGKNTVYTVPAGVYRYDPGKHSLVTVNPGDHRRLLSRAALGQMWLAKAPAIVVIGAVYPRITVKYGKRGVSYAMMEAGNSNQNVYLQSYAMGLKVGTIGAFNDAQVKAVLKTPANVTPLLLVGIGE